MLLTTHALASAAITTKIKNPLIGYPVIFAIHLIMDFIPHWDLGVIYKKLGKLKSFFWACFDGITGLVLAFFIYQYQSPFSPLLWGGVLIGLSPDLLEFPAVFLDFHLFALLDKLHGDTFHSQTKKVFWGLLPQVIIITAIVLFHR